MGPLLCFASQVFHPFLRPRTILYDFLFFFLSSQRLLVLLSCLFLLSFPFFPDSQVRLLSLSSHPPLIAYSLHMDSWRVAVLGDGGVGKTALAVQVGIAHLPFHTLAHLVCSLL